MHRAVPAGCSRTEAARSVCSMSRDRAGRLGARVRRTLLQPTVAHAGLMRIKRVDRAHPDSLSWPGAGAVTAQRRPHARRRHRCGACGTHRAGARLTQVNRIPHGGPTVDSGDAARDCVPNAGCRCVTRPGWRRADSCRRMASGTRCVARQ
ncbi:hypothetical protein BCEP4_520028 [Burkholderia cepacia]|nr:hypothetical protein BCEP4_520028 [Burkholderia cepacia]